MEKLLTPKQASKLLGVSSFIARIYGARSQKFKKVKQLLKDEDT